MKEFCFGTQERFEQMKQRLADGKCHIFRCMLPECCDRKQARIGFEHNRYEYIMYIDRGISSDTDEMKFQKFLKNGEMHFESMQELADFCYSLQPLFYEKGTNSKNDDIFIKKGNSFEQSLKTDDIVDVEALENLEKESVRNVWPDEIADRLKAKIYGQDEAVMELAELTSISQIRRNHKLLTMAFLGPTATGKSETARSLADILSELYGRKYGYIEIAGNEFTEEHTIHRFLGAPPGYAGYGNDTVLHPVRKNKFHVIVVNEIEKAHPKFLIALMEAIDTGFLGMADNSGPIDLNRSILVFTSNIPINMDAYNSAAPFEKSEICRDAFTEYCGRPEISGKICNFIVFKPLDSHAVTDILTKFIAEEVSNFGMTLRKIDTRLMHDLKMHAKSGYGARAIRELVGMSIGKQLLREKQVQQIDGMEVCISGTMENLQMNIYAPGR